MGQNSKIEWTTHTFNPWSGTLLVFATVSKTIRLKMDFIVAGITECNPIRHVKPQFWMGREWLNVMRSNILGATTFLTGKLVARDHIEPPPFVRGRKSLTPTASQISILEGVAGFAPGSSFACYLTDFNPCLNRMRLAYMIARPVLGCEAHFRPRLIAHFLAFFHTCIIPLNRAY